MRAVAFAILLASALATAVSAQSPMPVVVQAATPAVKSSQAPAPSPTSDSVPAMLRMLQDMKAANEETLRKQAATLLQLDELEKTAEQIKIYTKRG